MQQHDFPNLQPIYNQFTLLLRSNEIEKSFIIQQFLILIYFIVKSAH
mgnify:CR=1 FL=1